MVLEQVNTQSILFQLNGNSRVWIYQSNRELDEKEVVVLQSQLNGFVREWTAHSKQLSAASDIFYRRFIVLAVDESQAGASGCSIDKSVHFLQMIENQYDITLFDRMQFAYFDNNAVKTIASNDLKRLYTCLPDRQAEGMLSDDSVFFDNMVNTIEGLKSAWLKPLRESWHRRFL